MENAILGRGLDFSTPGGRLCNPGHSIEVSWFLLHLNKVLLDPEIEKIALSALLGAFEIGWDEQCGGGQGFANYSGCLVTPLQGDPIETGNTALRDLLVTIVKL